MMKILQTLCFCLVMTIAICAPTGNWEESLKEESRNSNKFDSGEMINGVNEINVKSNEGQYEDIMEDDFNFDDDDDDKNVDDGFKQKHNDDDNVFDLTVPDTEDADEEEDVANTDDSFKQNHHDDSVFDLTVPDTEDEDEEEENNDLSFDIVDKSELVKKEIHKNHEMFHDEKDQQERIDDGSLNDNDDVFDLTNEASDEDDFYKLIKYEDTSDDENVKTFKTFESSEVPDNNKDEYDDDGYNNDNHSENDDVFDLTQDDNSDEDEFYQDGTEENRFSKDAYNYRDSMKTVYNKQDYNDRNANKRIDSYYENDVDNGNDQQKVRYNNNYDEKERSKSNDNQYDRDDKSTYMKESENTNSDERQEQDRQRQKQPDYANYYEKQRDNKKFDSSDINVETRKDGKIRHSHSDFRKDENSVGERDVNIDDNVSNNEDSDVFNLK